MKRALYAIIVVVALLGTFLVVSRFAFRGALTPWLGEARLDNQGIEPGTDIHEWPELAGRRAKGDDERSSTSRQIIEHWADQQLVDWAENGKVSMTRAVLAKLLTARDVEEVNRYLLAARPYAGSGSSYELRPKADYDFAEIVLAGLPFLFADQPDVLWPETVDHIVHVLLIERGYGIRWTVPGSLGTVRDTENHILMTEGTRALRNQWLIRSGADLSPQHERRSRDHAQDLARFIDGLERRGLYEFNSQPYAGYTLTAVLIVHTFADEPELVEACRRLLDRISYQYAVSSTSLRRVVPFRRQLKRSDRTSVYEDPLTAAMLSWYGDSFSVGDIADQPNLHHAIVPAAMPYRPGALVDALMQGDGHATRRRGGRGLVLIGRGERSSPEIHYRGDGYMISAGGASWGTRSGIVARPTVLLQGDGATDLTAMLRIEGAGDLTTWNNTGVHRDFAVGAGPLRIPTEWRPCARTGNWRVFPLEAEQAGWVITYSGPAVSLFAVDADGQDDPTVLLRRVLAANPDAERLTAEFVTPAGASIAYDIHAPRGIWVIKSANGERAERDYQAWPRLRLIDR